MIQINQPVPTPNPKYTWFHLTAIKNWQTSVPWTIAMLAGFVALHPKYFNDLTCDIASYLALIMGGLGGVNSKYAGNGSNAPAEQADAVVKNAIGPNLNSPPRSIDTAESTT